MKLVTRFEAAALPTKELRGLYRQAFNAQALALPGSQNHQDALASMHNIEAELALRPPCGP
ncbi:hypothetical protein [Pseudooceanicola antarcticus]|uniref:Uncharacterized protein n=1 Tax=Pseudooceanicola antarcticus TaxID=1247613 RepID=A0ABX4MLZ1_9RHOB|nr:hypothetical protein [Pseudooceanicola antarcticus]PJE26428.1 hypothetical protein CVM39_17950 [Pseudooceanicola antarcticus]